MQKSASVSQHRAEMHQQKEKTQECFGILCVA